MAQSAEQQEATRERRVLVHQLLLRKHPKGDIARLVGVSAQTITKDVHWLESGWKKNLHDDLEKIKLLELATLEEAENQAWTRYRATLSVNWMSMILRIQQRRAKLLGLDAERVLPGETPDSPMYFAPAGLGWGDIDLSELTPELEEEALLWGAKVKALRPGVMGEAVDVAGQAGES
ncbi:MAG: hypothetical protein H8E48_06660 [Chloroflexi bacterium]|nr:hypothetical protein [Chloroflexota bacterium]